MIPKVIHYCWFGGKPMPKLANKCIKSWKKFCPDYELIEWNERNFDIEKAPLYVRQAYEAKKWAFVTDYVRFWALYNYGGAYFDTDVEMIKSVNEIIENGPFMACENDAGEDGVIISVATGLGFAAEKGMPLLRELLKLYENLSFTDKFGNINTKTVVEYTTELLKGYGLIDKNGIQIIEGITIYPTEYFCPKSLLTNRIAITENTYCVHHFAASWENKNSIVRGKIFRFLYRTFGEKTAMTAKKIFGRKGK